MSTMQPRKKARTLKRESTIDADVFNESLPNIMQRTLEEGAYRDGEVTRQLAEANTFQFERLMRVSLSPLYGARSWGLCGCAGLGSHFVMTAIEGAL